MELVERRRVELREVDRWDFERVVFLAINLNRKIVLYYSMWKFYSGTGLGEVYFRRSSQAGMAVSTSKAARMISIVLRETGRPVPRAGISSPDRVPT